MPRHRPSSRSQSSQSASQRRLFALAVVIFLLGASLVAYPYVSDYLHKISQAKVTATQSEVIRNTDTSKLESERAAALDYNRRLNESRSTITDPFDVNAQRVSTDEYNSLMSLAGDGVMGTLVIPAINLTVPIYHGTSDDVLQRGAGHLIGSSLPYGGKSTHAVLAGHNGLPSVRIFDDLHKLRKGDWFILQVLGEDHAYRVTGTETVLPNETDSLLPEEGRDLVTLVTCTPYGINTHRLLVHAERIPVPRAWLDRDKNGGALPNATPMNPMSTALLPFTLAGVAVVLGLLFAWLIAARRRRRRVNGRPVGRHVRG